MDFFNGSGSQKFISFRLGKEMDGQPEQNVTEQMEIDSPTVGQMLESENRGSPTDIRSIVELSSNTDTESCDAYIRRTAELLESAEQDPASRATEIPVEAKSSVSELVAVTPALNEMIPEVQLTESVPKVVFLDKPDSQEGTNNTTIGRQDLTSASKVVDQSLMASNPEVGVVATTTEGPSQPANIGLVEQVLEEPQVTPNLQGAQEGRQEIDASGSGDLQVSKGPMDYRYQTDEDSCFEMETDTGSMARSTLGQALYCPAKVREISCRDESSHDSNVADLPPNTDPPPLSGTSRAIIKQCFTETNPICLDPGHPVIALNQDQITSILRIVADESARASFEMLSSVVERASRLNLGSPAKTASRRRVPSMSGHDTDTDIGSDSIATYSTRRGGASSGMTSEAESQPDFQSSVAMPAPPTTASNQQVDLETDPHSPAVSSPGAQTLANVRQEAINEQRQARRQTSSRTRPRGQARLRRRIGRVMKEEYFETMPWTRTFVSGPVDPKWNKHKIYCQICKCNVSIRAKGPKEILRHFATERHLRKDQRWRYEYLTIEDPLTKRRRYQVRGQDGKVLSNYQLQLELPHFINCELVDIGEKLPFYDEAMAGVDYMASSPQNRARLQISVLGCFLPLSGDVQVLRGLWQQIGIALNHQAITSDIDWSTTRLSVSSLFTSD